MTQTVVIAGAGPTGLFLAAELRLAGVPAVVLEPRTEVPEHSRGMAVHGRTLETLDLRGLAQPLREQGMFAWPRTPFGFLWLDLESVGPEDYTYAMPQWRTEKLLEQHALGLGADLRRGHKVTGLDENADGVTVTVGTAEGSYQLEAAYLVGCDGADSTVRTLAGIQRREFPSSAYYGVLGDVQVKGDEEFDAGLHPAGVVGGIPLDATTLRLMTIEFDREPVSQDVPVSAGELAGSIGRITGRTPPLPNVDWLARFGEQSTLAEQFRAGRVFLAGDAAHVSFVSGTQGLNAGLQDAMNLGWKLAAEINGVAAPGLLDTYQTERHPAAVRANTHARAQMALMHPLRKVEPLREMFERLLQFPEVNQFLLRMPTQARHPEPAEGAHPLTGLRLGEHPVTTEDGETTVSRLLHGGRGVLLKFVGDDLGEAARWSERLEQVQAKPVADFDADVVLLRPDGHVAYAGAIGAELVDALGTWFGRP